MCALQRLRDGHDRGPARRCTWASAGGTEAQHPPAMLHLRLALVHAPQQTCGRERGRGLGCASSFQAHVVEADARVAHICALRACTS